LSSDAAYAPLSSSTAAAGEATAFHEVATSLGLGQSFRIALVMMPSVPFGAEIEVAQVVAGIVLLERAHAVPDVAVRAARPRAPSPGLRALP
jgi:hypothetical protein